MSTTVHYRVEAMDPRAHLFEVTCRVDRPDPQGQIFALPSWIRGSYLVRDFAKHVQNLEARDRRGAVTIERLDKRRFQCGSARGPLTIRYRVYAFDDSVRKAYLDTERGFFNGSSLFYLPQGFETAHYEIELRRPRDVACRAWAVHTTLPAVKITANGFGLYRAPDYETLIDHPVEMANAQCVDFKVDGIPHRAVFSGRCEFDRARVARDLARICHEQRRLFRREPALDRYLFLTRVTGSGYGGLEHRSSTALICSRSDLPVVGEAAMSKGYRTFLGLCSHEYFHLWNVKRLTPQAFAESTLATEAYTRDLWHYEGVTSYYDDLMLRRADVIDAPTYLDLLAEHATRLQRNPGRLQHTLADASFEAWIKYYQPDENANNATVSYYVKGALVALCLDLTLRLKSRVTLDRVMQSLWRRYGAKSLGVPEGALEAAAQELSGLKLTSFFDRALRSTADLPLAELLEAFGLRVELRAAHAESDSGGRSSGRATRSYIGLKFRPGETRIAQVLSDGPAMKADLSAGDVVVALDDWRVTPTHLAAVLERCAPNTAITVHAFRGDVLIRRTLTPAVPPRDTWTFTLNDTATAEQRRRRKRWIGA